MVPAKTLFRQGIDGYAEPGVIRLMGGHDK
jgi:hypothetical protein